MIALRDNLIRITLRRLLMSTFLIRSATSQSSSYSIFCTTLDGNDGYQDSIPNIKNLLLDNFKIISDRNEFLQAFRKVYLKEIKLEIQLLEYFHVQALQQNNTKFQNFTRNFVTLQSIGVSTDSWAQAYLKERNISLYTSDAFPILSTCYWILKLLVREMIGINVGNWVDSAQDRNYWRALVNAALNLRVQ